MNWPNLREASTKRGIVWIAGGAWIVIQALRGNAVNPDALFNQIDFWLGVVMTVAGAFGLLPDEPKTVRIELPPIDLQGRGTAPPCPDRDEADLGIGAVQPADELRLSAQRRPGPAGTADPNTYPRFGAGFGDRD